MSPAWAYRPLLRRWHVSLSTCPSVCPSYNYITAYSFGTRGVRTLKLCMWIEFHGQHMSYMALRCSAEIRLSWQQSGKKNNNFTLNFGLNQLPLSSLMCIFWRTSPFSVISCLYTSRPWHLYCDTTLCPFTATNICLMTLTFNTLTPDYLLV